MDHGQKFKPVLPGTTQEEKPFEFKPLDLSSITGQGAKTDQKKPKRKVIVPCYQCGVPGCRFEREVEVEDERSGSR